MLHRTDAAPTAHENHEAQFQLSLKRARTPAAMMPLAADQRRAIGRSPRPRPAPAGPHVIKETSMKWETPQACNLRFGFEITMYIAAR